MSFLVGIFWIVLGSLIMYFNQQIAKAFGRSSWMDQYLGGTPQGYVLIGFGIVVLGFLYVFGVVK